MSDDLTPMDSAPVESAPATESSAPADPMSAIMSRMDELTSSIADLRSPQPEQPQHSLHEAVQQPWEQPQQPEYEQGYEDEYGADPDAQALEQLQSYISQQVQAGVQAQVNPFITQQRAVQLEQKYPDLQKPEVAGPLVQQAEQYARALGSQLGLAPNQVAQLARDTGLIENLYLAGRAREKAAQETPAAATNGVQLEGSAAQADLAPEMSLADRVVAAGQKPQGFRWT